MSYQVKDLKEPTFLLIDKLEQKDILPFIRKSFEKKNWVYYFFNGLNLIFALVLFTLMFKEIFKGELRFSKEFAYFSYGLLATFLLIPLHEFIHVLAYKYVGAENTSYDMNLKKFYFLALADKFVVDARKFRIVILAPFVTISIVCFILIFTLPDNWKFMATGLFFTHTLFCSGDFGILSYYVNNQDKEIYTYDDVEKGESFFYEKVTGSS